MPLVVEDIGTVAARNAVVFRCYDDPSGRFQVPSGRLWVELAVSRSSSPQPIGALHVSSARDEEMHIRMCCPTRHAPQSATSPVAVDGGLDLAGPVVKILRTIRVVLRCLPGTLRTNDRARRHQFPAARLNCAPSTSILQRHSQNGLAITTSTIK